VPFDLIPLPLRSRAMHERDVAVVASDLQVPERHHAKGGTMRPKYARRQAEYGCADDPTTRSQSSSRAIRAPRPRDSGTPMTRKRSLSSDGNWPDSDSGQRPLSRGAAKLHHKTRRRAYPALLPSNLPFDCYPPLVKALPERGTEGRTVRPLLASKLARSTVPRQGAHDVLRVAEVLRRFRQALSSGGS
jgi:hypothetical protein